MKKKIYTFQDDLNKRLRDPQFRRVWEKSEVEYKLCCALIERRLAKKLSQRALAKKAHTTQAVISRIESMNSNPSLSLLKKIASALGAKIQISFT